MPFSILLPVYGHNFGVIYYLAMQALALRRLTCEAGHRLFLVRRAGEQFPGLREKLEREFQPEELLEIGDDDAGLAPIAERIVHDHGPLVAHVQGARQLRSLISLKKAQPKQLQLVYSVHSFSNGTWRAMPFTWIVSRLLRRHVDYTIFHTPFAIERFTGSGRVFADGRAGLMPLGLEASFARPEADSAAPKIDDRFRRLLDDDDTFRFIYLAVLSHGKGQAWLQEQMAPVLRRHRSAHLILAGTRDEAVCNAIERAAASAGVGGQVHMPGRVDRQDVPWVLRKCHVGLVPSRSETFGYNIVEPMAAGLPLLGTRTGVGQWLIMDYHTGIGIRFGDGAALARGAEYLIQNPVEAAKMGANASRVAATLFSWEDTVACHLRVYQSLMNQ